MWFSNQINWIISKVQGKVFFIDIFFSVGQGPRNAGKLNWNLLGSFSFIFILGLCGWWSKIKDPYIVRELYCILILARSYLISDFSSLLYQYKKIKVLRNNQSHISSHMIPPTHKMAYKKPFFPAFVHSACPIETLFFRWFAFSSLNWVSRCSLIIKKYSNA